MSTPNPVWHLRISLIKSVLRIGAGSFLFVSSLETAGILLILAEVLGVVEELV